MEAVDQSAPSHPSLCHPGCGLYPVRLTTFCNLKQSNPRLTRGRMIIVMTMNVGFFFGVTIGYFIGELVFGRIGNHSFVGSAC